MTGNFLAPLCAHGAHRSLRMLVLMGFLQKNPPLGTGARPRQILTRRTAGGADRVRPIGYDGALHWPFLQEPS